MPTLTVKIAAGGTTIDSNGSSLAGHMWLSILCLLLVTLLGCATLNPTMPVKIPIDLSKADSVAEADFWIPTDDRVVLSLNFFKSGNQGDRKHLSEFVGSSGRTGTIIPLKIKLLKQINSKHDEIMLEKFYLTDGLRGVGNAPKYIDRTIDRVNIKSGAYRIKVETVESFPQLIDTLVQFEIYYSRAPK